MDINELVDRLQWACDLTDEQAITAKDNIEDFLRSEKNEQIHS